MKWKNWRRFIYVKRARWLYLILALLLPLTACQGATNQQTPVTLKIGLVGPFSGEFQSLGQQVHNGVMLAVEGWNQRGGVLGHPVEIVLLDSQCDPATAQDALLTAMEEEQVQFVIGGVCGDVSERVARIAMRHNLLQISPASVQLDLTLDDDGDLRPLVFRAPFVDPAQGIVAAQFALHQLGAESAVILTAQGSPYGKTLADAFEEAFQAEDGKIKLRATYDREAHTFFDRLTDVRDAAPDVLYLPGYYTVMNELVPQARSYGINARIIGSDGWDSPQLDTAKMGGCYFTTHYAPDDPRDVAKQWNQLYTGRYLVPPDALATLGYDAANILLTALQESKVPEPYLVAQTMEKATFNTVSGEVHFDTQHNPIKPVTIVQVRDGKIVYVNRLLPATPTPTPTPEVEP